MGTYLYTARTEGGDETVGRAEGATAAEVRSILEAQGLGEITIHTDSFIASVGDAGFAELPEVEVRPEDELAAQRGGMGQFWLMLLRANLPILLPLLAWNAWSIYAGRPFGWGDGIGFALTLAFLAFLVRSAIPVVAYNQLLAALAWGRWTAVVRCVGWLRRFPSAAQFAPHQLDYYLARADIGSGRRDAGFARYQGWANDPSLPPILHIGHMAALHDAAREFDAAESRHRELAALLPDSAQPWIDIGALLARRGGRIEEAEAALREGEGREMTPLVQAFARYARGILLIDKGEAANAVVELVSAAQLLSTVGTNPLLQLLRAIIQAFLAIALMRLGRRREADRMWRAVLPRMQALRMSEAIDRFAAAAIDREWQPKASGSPAPSRVVPTPCHEEVSNRS